MEGPDMGGLILYGACNGGPGIVRNVPNFTRLTASENRYNNFEIPLGVFMPNIATNHAITYTNTYQCTYICTKRDFQIYGRCTFSSVNCALINTVFRFLQRSW